MPAQKFNYSRFLSPESAFLTLEMLKDNNINNNYLYTGIVKADELPTYWNTGTSNSFRDAWAVGIIGNYVFVSGLGILKI